MKSLKTLVGVALIGSALGFSTAPAMAVDGVLFKVEVSSGYCHMKYRALEEDSLTVRPELQDASTTDIIDFYGPCDHDLLGAEEVIDQRISQQLYEDTVD